MQPTFVASALLGSNYSATTSPKTVSVTTQVGDRLVVIATNSDPDGPAINTPTGGTGLSWTLEKHFNAGSAPDIYIWTATATTAETFTLSVARASTDDTWGGRYYQFRGSDGIGASAMVATHLTGAPSLAITTTADNSVVIAFVADWNESTVTSRTWRTINSVTPSSGNGLEKDAVRVSGSYSILSAYWSNVGTAGSKTTGLTAPTGMDYSMVAIEVKGSNGGGGPTAPAVSTAPASNVDEDSATLNGNITDDGTETITRRGFVLDDASISAPGNVDPDTLGLTVVDESGSFGEGTFSLSATSLTTDTPYFYRAFAENTEGFGYGEQQTFTPTAAPPPAAGKGAAFLSLMIT